jgi:hypothetical protein
MTFPRSAAAAALPLLLTACSVTLPVDVSSDLAFLAPSGAYQVSQQIDLSQQGELWSRHGQVDAVSVDEVVVSVLSVGGGQQATSLSVTLAFRPDGAPSDGSQDVLLPAIPSLSFTPGSRASVPGSAGLDALLLQALRGSGRFQVVASGALNGLADATVRVQLKGSAAYSTSGG